VARTGRAASALPLVATLRSYSRADLRPDVTAGLVLATMLVPQGLAYAELTGLPAITGVYTTIAALLAYAAVGPNRRLVLGPDSSLAPVIAAVVVPLAAGDPATAIALASTMSLLAGGVCIAAGALRLGAINELLSKPIRIGYLNGIAALILLSQLPKALGFSGPADASASALVSATVRGVLDGRSCRPRWRSPPAASSPSSSSTGSSRCARAWSSPRSARPSRSRGSGWRPPA
jgi:MFS superfamily sulfate permease-like transporter